jgi:membrane protease YdiL (CAAX protease family)
MSGAETPMPAEPHPKLPGEATSSQAPPWRLGEVLGLFLAYALLALVFGVAVALLALRWPVRPLAIFGIALHQASAVALVWYLCRRRGRSLASAGWRLPQPGSPGLVRLLARGFLQLVVFSVIAAAITLGFFELVLGRSLPAPPNPFAVMEDWPTRSLLLLIVSVGAPISEELLFRGVLYRWLRARRGYVTALILSSTVFALAHFEPAFVLMYLAAGLAFANVTEASDSVVPAMLLHGTMNLAVAVQAL